MLKEKEDGMKIIISTPLEPIEINIDSNELIGVISSGIRQGLFGDDATRNDSFQVESISNAIRAIADAITHKV